MKRIIALVLLLAAMTLRGNAQFTCPTPKGKLSQQALASLRYVNSTVTVEILLVEFNDVRHRKSPSAYKRADFFNVLLSTGSYVSPNKYSPDGDAVYGSMADYFNKMSSGNLLLTGYVINNAAYRDIPVWVTLPHNKVEYDDYMYDFYADVRAAAASAGLDLHEMDNSRGGYRTAEL